MAGDMVFLYLVLAIIATLFMVFIADKYSERVLQKRKEEAEGKERKMYEKYKEEIEKSLKEIVDNFKVKEDIKDGTLVINFSTTINTENFSLFSLYLSEDKRYINAENGRLFIGNTFTTNKKEDKFFIQVGMDCFSIKTNISELFKKYIPYIKRVDYNDFQDFVFAEFNKTLLKK